MRESKIEINPRRCQRIESCRGRLEEALDQIDEMAKAVRTLLDQVNWLQTPAPTEAVGEHGQVDRLQRVAHQLEAAGSESSLSS